MNKLSFIPVVPKGVSTESLTQKEDGTGSYRLQYWDQRQNRIKIIRNETYWDKLPAIKEAVFFLGLDDQQAISKLISGECQFFQGSSRNSEAAVKGNKKFRVEQKDSLYVKYLGFNFQNRAPNSCSLAPNYFDNRLLRSAIHEAIDRAKLISALTGYAFPVTQAVPPFTFGYNPSLPPPKYDPVQARNLLSQAGFPDGFEATMHVRKVLSEPAQLVANQLAEIGIRLQLKIFSDAEFFRDLRGGHFCMFLSRFGSPTGDASDILESAFHTYDPVHHFGQLNYGRYSNPVLDAAIVESSEIQQLERRKLHLQEIMGMLAQERVWVPLYGDQDIYIYDSSFLWKPRIDSLIKIWEISREPL